MATYTGIIVYQLGGVGATHAQGDTIIGVYEMVVVDNGGTSASGASFADTTMHEGQYEYFNTGQSFTINGILYENVIDLDTGSIAIDGVTIDGARVEFVDPGTGQTVEHFIPLQADDADAYTVQAGDTITTVFAVSGTDADQLDYADMYTGYTPSLDYIVEVLRAPIPLMPATQAIPKVTWLMPVMLPMVRMMTRSKAVQGLTLFMQVPAMTPSALAQMGQLFILAMAMI